MRFFDAEKGVYMGWSGPIWETNSRDKNMFLNDKKNRNIPAYLYLFPSRGFVAFSCYFLKSELSITV